jgi:hypothetical protein
MLSPLGASRASHPKRVWIKATIVHVNIERCPAVAKQGKINRSATPCRPE